jgi:hypothetical protein
MQSYGEIHVKISQGCRDKPCSGSFLAKAATPCFHTVLTSSYFFFILELLALKMNGAHTVQDPEQSLLDSNFVKPNKLQLLFCPSRKYAASTHFIHIRVPFNFSQLLATPMNIFNHYHNYIKKWPEPFRTQVEEVAEISRSCLADKVDFEDILDTLPQYKVITCDKCLVALGMSTVALTLSTFNSARISTLE